MTTLLELVKEAQRAYSRGEVSREFMAQAQSAYDSEQSRQERDAACVARTQRQQAIWDSIRGADRAAISRFASAWTRTVGGRTYYVPPTNHWAQWHDEDAIRYHGVQTIDALLERFMVLSSEPWDGTYRHLWFFAE